MSIKLNFKVESYDVQPNGNIKMSSLLKFLQKCAGDDLLGTSLSYQSLALHNIAFVLTKMNVKILNDIKLYDELTIISHPRKVRGAQFPRDFIIKVNNQTVAVASSLWVLIDLEKRSILRPSSIDSIGHIPPSEEDSFNIPDIRRVIDESILSRTDVRVVRYSNLDMNNHLNNTFYADYIFDLIKYGQHASDKGLYIQINYKTEALLGDTLEIYSSELSGKNTFDFQAINEKTGKICFTAYVDYTDI